MGDRIEDGELIKKVGEDRFPDLTYMHLRNMWTVDGLYFLGIEKRFGTEAATEIDAEVWKVMGKIEARKIRKFLALSDDLGSMVTGLKYSGWAQDLEDKEWETRGGSEFLRTLNCRIQNNRLRDGLDLFPCKLVRFGFLKAFAKEFNENIEVICHQCPPGELEEGKWCEWEFRMKEGS
ncbi:MAG: DUF6125 family protein [Thermoplasmatota archaeon]